MDSYINNTEIIQFLGRAKAKIAAIGTASITGSNDHIGLAIELKKVIRSIESPFLDWTEAQVLKAVHYYNHRADLTSIPFFAYPGYRNIIVKGEAVANSSSNLEASDIVDFQAAVLQAIKQANHDELAGIKGPGTHHLTAQEKSYIDNLVNPKAPATVSISGDKNSGILYKKGVNLAPIKLTSTINLNSGGAVLAKRFYLNNVLLITGLDSVEYTQEIYESPTFRFEADFADGSTKSASITYTMVTPLRFGLSGSPTPYKETLTNKVSSLEIIFPFETKDFKPYFMVPVFMGDITKIEINGFDTLPGGANWHKVSGTNFSIYIYLGNYNQSFKIKLIW